MRSDALHHEFHSFTALPPANDFGSFCDPAVLGCSGEGTELHVTTDAVGNLLIPMNWTSVLAADADGTRSRLLLARLGMPQTMSGFCADVSSLTLQGARVPPFLAHLREPSEPTMLLGTADAPRTI